MKNKGIYNTPKMELLLLHSPNICALSKEETGDEPGIEFDSWIKQA